MKSMNWFTYGVFVREGDEEAVRGTAEALARDALLEAYPDCEVLDESPLYYITPSEDAPDGCVVAITAISFSSSATRFPTGVVR